MDDAFKSLGNLFLILIPLIQYTFLWLPESVTNIYIDKSTFYVTSIFTIIFSIILFNLYSYKPHLNSPIFVWREDWKKWRHHFNYDNICIYLWILFLGSVFLFIYIWINFQSTINTNIIFVQSLLYFTIFSSSFFILLHYCSKLYGTKKRSLEKKNHIKDAINLAIDHSSFDEIPSINFKSILRWSSYRINLINVEINKKIYQIEIEWSWDSMKLISVRKITKKILLPTTEVKEENEDLLWELLSE